MFNRYYYFLLIKLVCHHQTSLMRFLLYRNCLNCLMKMKTDSADRRTYTFWPWRLRQPPQHFEQFHNFAVFWDFNAMSIGNLVDWMTSILTSIASVSISSVSFYLMDWIIIFSHYWNWQSWRCDAIKFNSFSALSSSGWKLIQFYVKCPWLKHIGYLITWWWYYDCWW